MNSPYRRIIRHLAPALMLLAWMTSSPASPPLAERKALTLEAATQVVAAAQAEAERRKSTVVIAVVDEGGYPILLQRLDDTQVASVQVAIDKARTAAIFRRPSRDFEEQVKKGRVSAIALAGAVPLIGGLPLVHEGRVIGAIGVSGNTPQEDEDIARAGVMAFEGKGNPPPVAHFPHDRVSNAFTRGAPIIETGQYKVHASRRDAPGQAEIHLRETDVIYVLEGEAEFVTGGQVVEAVNTAPGEIRGPSIEGGKSRRLRPGDVIVVPPNTPHWFRSVKAPFLYYVVKPIGY